MTTMSTFLSLTVHCARCHNHKFDPILQADYYRLQAVFAGVDRADRSYDPDPQVARSRTTLKAQVAELESHQKRFEDSLAQISSPQIKEIDQHLGRLTRELAALPAENGKASSTLGYHSLIWDKQDDTKWVQVDLGQSLPIDELILGYSRACRIWRPCRPRLRLSAPLPRRDFGCARFLGEHDHRRSYESRFPESGRSLGSAWRLARSACYVRVTATKLWNRTNDWIFALAELAVLSNKTNVARSATVSSLDSIEAPPGWAMKNLIDGYDSRTRLAFEGAGDSSHRGQLEQEIERLGSGNGPISSRPLNRSGNSAEEFSTIAGELKHVNAATRRIAGRSRYALRRKRR